MKPEQKAVELIDKYFNLIYGAATFDESCICANKCALTSVEEILTLINYGYNPKKEIKYWQEVKREIEKRINK